MKTSELTGSALNWAVAKCEEGFNAEDWLHDYRLGFTTKFSTAWSQGGPIIEREKIKVAPNLSGSWHGQIRHTGTHPLVDHPVLTGFTNAHGPTPLIAAMRCFVASKLGDEVEVPQELTP